MGSTAHRLGSCRVLRGSSPLAWGRRAGGPFEVRCVFRFIPTRVGSTSLHLRSLLSIPVHPHSRGVDYRHYSFPASPCPVHPHSRGVDVSSAGTGSFQYGSSPLAWGRRRSRMRCRGDRRFIPTRVGSTILYDEDAIMTDGSSPLAWGRRTALGT